MYNILVIDPDRVNRIKIRQYVDESGLDFEVTHDTEDIETALTILDKETIHLIVAEHDLPKRNGIQFFYDLQETHPNIKFILFTDYHHFHATREALSHGILDFLFKPVRKNDIIKSLVQAYKVLRDEEKSLSELANLKVEYNKRIDVFKDRFLINLLHGHIETNREIIDLFAYFNIPVKNAFTILLVKIDDYKQYNLALEEEEKQFLVFKVLALIENFLADQKYGFCFINRFDEITIILTEPFDQKTLILMCSDLKDKTDNLLSLSLTIGIGKTYEEPIYLTTSYKQAKAALRHNFYLGKGSIIHIDFVQKGEDVSFLYPISKEKLLVYETVAGNREKVSQLLHELFHALSKVDHFPEHFFTSLILTILLSTNRIANEQNLPLEDFYKNFVDTKSIRDIETALAAYNYLEEVLLNICRYQVNQRTEATELFVEKIGTYIHTHYAEKISLSNASIDLNTTSYYLEQIVKQSLHMTYYDYCISIRIQKAKEFLRNTQLTLTEIAEAIGFSNPDYFSAIFKGETHMSPKQYKELPLYEEK